MRIIVKYTLGLLLFFSFLGIYWYRDDQVVMPVETVIHTKEIDNSIYKDMAYLAYSLGNPSLALTYLEKAPDEKLATIFTEKCREKETLRQIIDEALLLCDHKTENVFDRLIAVESLEDEEVVVDQGQLLLLLANVSLERGFVGWPQIAKQLTRYSKQIEGKNNRLSVLCYTLSQYEMVDEHD